MFWDHFYTLCKEKNLTPNAVCRAIGLSSATATHWKNGIVPKGDILIKLADYLGCSTDYLLGREPSDASAFRVSLQGLLLEARQRFDLEIDAAAKRAGMTRKRLMELERGVDSTGQPCAAPSSLELKQLAAAYDLPLHQLQNAANYTYFSFPDSQNADIRIIARACEKMDEQKLSQLRKYAQFLQQEEFNEK